MTNKLKVGDCKQSPPSCLQIFLLLPASSPPLFPLAAGSQPRFPRAGKNISSRQAAEVFKLERYPTFLTETADGLERPGGGKKSRKELGVSKGVRFLGWFPQRCILGNI